MLFVFVLVSYILAFPNIPCPCADYGKCCEDGACEGYMGSEAGCYCWINYMMHTYNLSSTKAAYMPSGTFSNGECEFCSVSGGAHYDKPYPYGPMTMSYHVCMDDPDCKYFDGSADECTADCEYYQNRTNLFINGEMKIVYLPPGEWSNGGCLCSGKVYPCRLSESKFVDFEKEIVQFLKSRRVKMK